MGSNMDGTGDGAAEWASDRPTTSLMCTSLGSDDKWMRSEPACRPPTSFSSIEYLRSVHEYRQDMKSFGLSRGRTRLQQMENGEEKAATV